MSGQQELQALAEQVARAIPLAAHLQFRYLDFTDSSLRLSAPLAPNHNDKGTFFAGSQSALLTLAGWSLVTLLAKQKGIAVDVVAVESEQRYSLPLHSDIVIQASADAKAVALFLQRLERKGKASLKVTAQASNDHGVEVCRYQGLYLARILEL